MLPKLIKLFLIFVSSIIFVTLIIFIFEKTYPKKQVKFGVSFSPGYARYLNLDWQKTYLQILDELKVKHLRLSGYWDIIEAEPQKYDFSETDFMLTEAEKRELRVILIVGARQPRWPECHYPNWASKLSVSQRQQKTLELIQKVVERYKDKKSIWAYQVENEPFAWWFGENCDPPNSEFLQSEVALVKELDKKRPVIITDSGELGWWVDSINPADILGISVYRQSFNSPLNLYIPYPVSPGMYALKAGLIKRLYQNKKIIISELQTEPWLSDKDARENLPLRHNQLFSLANFKSNIEFAKKIGFDEAYLWGVEWWYFMDKMGYSEYLEYAKTIF